MKINLGDGCSFLRGISTQNNTGINLGDGCSFLRRIPTQNNTGIHSTTQYRIIQFEKFLEWTKTEQNVNLVKVISDLTGFKIEPINIPSYCPIIVISGQTFLEDYIKHLEGVIENNPNDLISKISLQRIRNIQIKNLPQ